MFRLAVAVSLIIAEIALIALVYQIFVDFDCAKTDYYTACRGLRSGVVRGGVVFAVLVVYLLKRRDQLAVLLAAAASHRESPVLLFLNASGFALVFLPLLIFPQGQMEAHAISFLLIVAGGAGAMLLCLMRWTLRWNDWRNWIFADGWLLPAFLTGAFFLPDIAQMAQPLWEIVALNKLTFLLVYSGLYILGVEVYAQPADFLIVAHDFPVIIAAACSGVEGLALMTGFMAIYALLMQGDLKTRRYWGVLFPMALLLSWLFNVVRIIALLLIGAFVSPEHAIEGFHSYAGWMLFTLLAIAVVYIANAIPWFHKSDRRPSQPPSLTDDQVAYQILPLVVFLVSGIIVNTLWANPADGYPLQVVLMLGAVLYFFRPIRALDWSLDATSVLVGLGIGILWLAPVWNTAQAGYAPSAFWLITRLIGTILLVPLIEELFFRGYLLRKLNLGGWPMLLVAIIVTSAIFGLLHDRIVAGTLAGIAFALVKLKRDRLCDPIQSHATANAVVALGAIWTGDFTLI